MPNILLLIYLNISESSVIGYDLYSSPNFLMRDTEIPIETVDGYNTPQWNGDNGYGYYLLERTTRSVTKAQEIQDEIAKYFQTPQGRYRKRAKVSHWNLFQGEINEM